MLEVALRPRSEEEEAAADEAAAADEGVELDDKTGVNSVSLGGSDAALFELDGGELFLKAGTALDFEPDHLRLLAFGAEARALGQGTRLYRQDSLSDGGFVVVRGNVDLISGRNDSIISSHGSGSLIGEMALITETRHAATAVATENSES